GSARERVVPLEIRRAPYDLDESGSAGGIADCPGEYHVPARAPLDDDGVGPGGVARDDVVAERYRHQRRALDLRQVPDGERSRADRTACRGPGGPRAARPDYEERPRAAGQGQPARERAGAGVERGIDERAARVRDGERGPRGAFGDGARDGEVRIADAPGLIRRENDGGGDVRHAERVVGRLVHPDAGAPDRQRVQARRRDRDVRRTGVRLHVEALHVHRDVQGHRVPAWHAGVGVKETEDLRPVVGRRHVAHPVRCLAETRAVAAGSRPEDRGLRGRISAGKCGNRDSHRHPLQPDHGRDLDTVVFQRQGESLMSRMRAAYREMAGGSLPIKPVSGPSDRRLWLPRKGQPKGCLGYLPGRRRTAAPNAQRPLAISAQVEGSGTGVKLSIRLLPNSLTENVPPPNAFWKSVEESTRNEFALNPPIDEVEISVQE